MMKRYRNCRHVNPVGTWWICEMTSSTSGKADNSKSLAVAQSRGVEIAGELFAGMTLGLGLIVLFGFWL